jgi:hypothetical protein
VVVGGSEAVGEYEIDMVGVGDMEAVSDAEMLHERERV